MQHPVGHVAALQLSADGGVVVTVADFVSSPSVSDFRLRDGPSDPVSSASAS
jgi:hypothetical protein